jgi:hypothetical protein
VGYGNSSRQETDKTRPGPPRRYCRDQPHHRARSCVILRPTSGRRETSFLAAASPRFSEKSIWEKRDGLGPAQYFVSKRVFFPRAELFFRVLCYTRFGLIPGFQMGPVEFACMPRERMCSQLTIATEYIGIAAMERRYYCTSAVKTTLSSLPLLYSHSLQLRKFLPVVPIPPSRKP